jgi:NADPH:quinone reductase-like Zn-dependent oxidoreductase
VQDLGADEVVDYKNVRFEERYRLSPFDVVVDTIGGAPDGRFPV